jgi:hypothetical protein
MYNNEKRKLQLQDEDTFFNSESVASSTECTGLIPTPPVTEDEAESYTKIYDVPHPKDKVNNGLQHE